MYVVVRAALVAVVCAASAAAQSAPPGFSVENAFPGVSFGQPTQVVFLPDGRALVAEKSGWISVVAADGTLNPSPFISLRAEVLATFDRGLLGIAISPDYETDPWVYFLYTVDPNFDFNDEETDAWCRLMRMRPRVDEPDRADTATREYLIGETWADGIPTLDTSHTIGTVMFAPDGSLLVGAGDGGHWEGRDTGGQDPDAFGPGLTDPEEDIGAFRARSLNSLAGKILRIDPETGAGLDSNPYWDGDPFSDASRVWLYGLRNPFRFSLVPGTGSANPADGDPGALLIGDVGWATYEILHFAPTGGMNFGWPCYEGPQTTSYFSETTFTGNTNVLCNAVPNPENPTAETPATRYLHHSDGASSAPWGWTGRSITGGVVYDGTEYPSTYRGRYFFTDWVNDWIRVVTLDTDGTVVGYSTFVSNAGGPVAFTTDPTNGDIVYTAYLTGEVRRISYTEVVGAGDPATSLVTEVAAGPNPFSRSASVTFRMSEAMDVTVRIFDAAGRRVRDLVTGPLMAGRHDVTWDGLDDRGLDVAAGMYFVRISANGAVLGEARLSRLDR